MRIQLISSVQNPPPPPPLPSQFSQHTTQPHQHFQHQSKQLQTMPKNSQIHAPNVHTRNDKRREFKESSTRWHEPHPSTSRHRNNSKMEYLANRRPYEKEIDTSKERHRDRNRDRDRGRDRSRDLGRRDRTRDRDRDENRDRDRDRKHERDRSRSMKRDDRVSMKCDDRRIHQYGSNRKESRSRSRSRSTFSMSSRNQSRNTFVKSDKSKSYESNRRSTSRSLMSKPELSPAKPLHVDDTRLTDEKIPQYDSDKTERARILEKWRSNYCETSEDITRKLEELAEDTEKECWIRSSPADLYYKRTSVNEIEATARLEALCTLFKTELVDRGPRVRKSKPPLEVQPKKRLQRVCRHKSEYHEIPNQNSNFLSTQQFINHFSYSD